MDVARSLFVFIFRWRARARAINAPSATSRIVNNFCAKFSNCECWTFQRHGWIRFSEKRDALLSVEREREGEIDDRPRVLKFSNNGEREARHSRASWLFHERKRDAFRVYNLARNQNARRESTLRIDATLMRLQWYIHARALSDEERTYLPLHFPRNREEDYSANEFVARDNCMHA